MEPKHSHYKFGFNVQPLSQVSRTLVIFKVGVFYVCETRIVDPNYATSTVSLFIFYSLFTFHMSADSVFGARGHDGNEILFEHGSQMCTVRLDFDHGSIICILISRFHALLIVIVTLKVAS